MDFPENKRNSLSAILLIPLMSVALWTTIITAIMGNFWFTQKGVLYKLQINDSSVMKIEKTKRNIWTSSIILTTNQDKTMSVYELDSNIFFGYKLKFIEKNQPLNPESIVLDSSGPS